MFFPYLLSLLLSFSYVAAAVAVALFVLGAAVIVDAAAAAATTTTTTELLRRVDLEDIGNPFMTTRDNTGLSGRRLYIGTLSEQTESYTLICTFQIRL